MNIYDNWLRERKRLIKKLRARFLKASKEDAEDAVEASLELLFTKGLIFAEIEECSVWLHVTAFFRLSNEMRKSNRLAPLDAAYYIGFDDEIISAFENHDMIEKALEILDEDDRVLLLKKFYEGISIPEIARSKGATAAKLQKQAQRAIKKIREKAKNI